MAADLTTAPAADSAVLIAIKLNAIWRIKSGDSYGVTSDAKEVTTDSFDSTLAYIAAAPQETSGKLLAGVKPLYRLVGASAAYPDNMDTTQVEQNYIKDGILGYVWEKSTFLPGMVELLSVNYKQAGDPGRGSHAFILSMDIMHKQKPWSGRIVNGRIGYAYPRFNVNEALVSASGGGVTVKSNANTGGAVWEWWWGGEEFINDFDYGRQLSMAVYCETGQALQETGDKYGTSNIPLYARHPSPTLSVVNLSSNQQSTRAIPIEWTPDQHGGGKDNAIIYANAKIGKNLVLNWRGPDAINRNWPVALYESVYEGPPFSIVNVEAPTAYLNSKFSVYYKYDPKSDSLTLIHAKDAKVNISGGGADGLILASGHGPDAIGMGVYKNDPNAGIVLYDDSGPSVGNYGAGFSKWGIVYRSSVSARWTFRSWIITDRVQNIQRDFHQLYVWNVKSRDLKPHEGN